MVKKAVHKDGHFCEFRYLRLQTDYFRLFFVTIRWT
jgi:hypothetical protein